jgi:hypothetical protein
VSEVEGEAGRRGTDQSAEAGAGVQNSDERADIPAAEIINHHCRKQRHPDTIGDAKDERKAGERPQAGRQLLTKECKRGWRGTARRAVGNRSVLAIR